jgi:hypothetical protein
MGRLSVAARAHPLPISVSMSPAAQPVAVPKPRVEDWPVVWIWPIGLVLMQMTFVRVGDFDITLAVIVCHVVQLHLILRYWLNRPSVTQTVIYLGALAYALAFGTIAADPDEFLRSLAHITNLIVMIALCMNARFAGRIEIGRSMRVFCYLAMGTALVVIAQSIAFNIFGDLSFTRLLGDLTPARGGLVDPEPYAPHELSPIKRANGWFSEPSAAAWFCAFAATIALGLRPERPVLATLTATICLAGGVATLTLTGLLSATIVLVAYLLFVRDRGWFKILWLLLAVFGVAGAWLVGQHFGLLNRVQEIETPGTSIYFRFVAPYLLVSDSLNSYPLGYPVGQVDLIEDKHYFMNWPGGSQTNIDNMLFLVVFHFGLLGIFFNLAYLQQLARLLVRYRRVIGLIMLGVTLMLIATGAGWAHHGVLLIGYAIAVARYVRSRPSVARSSAPRATFTPLPTMALLSRGTRRAGLPRAAWPLRGAAP